MEVTQNLTRRDFIRTTTAGAAATALGANSFGQETAGAEASVQVPLKIGHRAASMRMVGDFDIFRVARQIPGLTGVELQVAAGNPNLWDFDAARRYKKEAWRWGVMIPSVAGVWNRGVSIMRAPVAGINLARSIRSAEIVGASVILVAFFRDNAPDMSDESSYSPVVQLLKEAAPIAAEAGVILGLENSLSPEDNRKLVDLVGHPSVGVYYDPHNMAFYGHGEQAVTGFKLLGRERICQVHVKNGDQLIEAPGPVNWRAAFDAAAEIGYDGWYVFESSHADRANLLDATRRNIEYMQKHIQMPKA